MSKGKYLGPVILGRWIFYAETATATTVEAGKPHSIIKRLNRSGNWIVTFFFKEKIYIKIYVFKFMID